MHQTAAPSSTGNAVVLMTGREMKRYRDLKQVTDLTLAEALQVVSERRWKGMRSYVTSMSQSRKALADLTLIVRPDLAAETPERRNELIRHNEVKQEHVAEVVGQWRDANREATLVNRRLVCFSVLMLPVTGHYQRIPRKLKWWLKPDAEALVIKRAREDGEHLLADYILWTTRTGLRVEENLRLTRSAFAITSNGRVLVTVPGLKTAQAEATLPLMPDAAEVFRRRLGREGDAGDRLFPISYDNLAIKWRIYSVLAGGTHAKGATLKALRRSAARHLHIGREGKNPMPLDMVRTYLRHETLDTTLGYLRLTGGYDAAEFERYM